MTSSDHPRRRALALPVLAGLLLSASACGGDTAPVSPTSSAPAPAATAAPDTSTAANPTPSDASPSTPTLSADDLEAALLTAKDLPKGFKKDTFIPEAAFRSSDKKCDDLIDRVNDLTAGKEPNLGAVAIHARDSGAFIERLEARESEDAVAADLKTLRASAEACSTVVFDVGDRGKLSGKVRVVDPPALGDDALAVELTFSAVRTAVFPLTVVRLGPVELQAFAVDGSSTDKVTKAAVAKAEDKLPG